MDKISTYTYISNKNLIPYSDVKNIFEIRPRKFLFSQISQKSGQEKIFDDKFDLSVKFRIE